MSEDPILTVTVHHEGREWRKVRMTPELMRMLADAATARGNIIEWGKPDADGFYTPTITLTAATLGQVQRALS